MSETLGSRLQRLQIRWRLASAPVRVGTVAFGAAAACAVAVVLVSSSRAIDATTASILVAIFFGITAVVQQRQAQRRQHTIDLITAFQSAEALSSADEWMADRIVRHSPVGADVSGDDQR